MTPSFPALDALIAYYKVRQAKIEKAAKAVGIGEVERCCKTFAANQAKKFVRDLKRLKKVYSVQECDATAAK